LDPYLLTVEDHPLFRSALKLAVAEACPECHVIETGSLAEARQALQEHGRPLLILLDVNLPDSKGLAGLIELRAVQENAPIAIVSGDEGTERITSALRLGAAGFIPKSSPLETIIEAITHLVAGMTWSPILQFAVQDDELQRIASLTLAQQRVLIGLQKGLLNKQIAYDSGVSEATVKAHMTAIFRKLGVHNRTQAVLAARRSIDLLAGDTPRPDAIMDQPDGSQA
jgi:DNA-binding NarL/FixJ family response regulator